MDAPRKAMGDVELLGRFLDQNAGRCNAIGRIRLDVENGGLEASHCSRFCRGEAGETGTNNDKIVGLGSVLHRQNSTVNGRYPCLGIWRICSSYISFSYRYKIVSQLYGNRQHKYASA